MDPRFGGQGPAIGAKVDHRGRRRLGAAPGQPPELTAQCQHDSLARNVLEDGRARNHGRQHRVARAANAQAPGEQEPAYEWHLAEGELAQSTVCSHWIGVDRNLVARHELVDRQELVQFLHATSQILWATRA